MADIRTPFSSERRTRYDEIRGELGYVGVRWSSYRECDAHKEVMKRLDAECAALSESTTPKGGDAP